MSRMPKIQGLPKAAFLSGTHAVVVRHPAGPVRISWFLQDGLVRIRSLDLLPLQEPVPPQGEQPAQIARLMGDLAEGRDLAWVDGALLWEGLSPFRRQVLSTLQRATLAGAVLSYGDLARLCGRPGAARAVGGAVAANPFPIVVPCHRVLASDRRLGGFMGDPQDRTGWKRRLLEREGCRIHRGRVHGPVDSRPVRLDTAVDPLPVPVLAAGA